MTGKQVEETVNATDAEDAFKYLPSLLVRKRYIGDYDHAVLATRASGTGNSARSLVFADGILLSNLLGNGAELHAALGPGHARGDRARGRALRPVLRRVFRQLRGRGGRLRDAHADTHSRRTRRCPASPSTSTCIGPTTHYPGYQASASVGDRSGAFSWWINANHLD